MKFKIDIKKLLILFSIICITTFGNYYEIAYANNLNEQEQISKNNEKQIGAYAIGNFKDSALSSGYYALALDDGNAVIFSILGQHFNKNTNKFEEFIHKMEIGNGLDVHKSKAVQINKNCILVFGNYFARPEDGGTELFINQYNPYTKKASLIKKVKLSNLLSNSTIYNAKKISENKILLHLGCGRFYLYDIENNTLSDLIELNKKLYEYYNSTEYIGIEPIGNGKCLIFGLGYCKKNDIQKKTNYVFEFDSNTKDFKIIGELSIDRGSGFVQTFRQDENNIFIIGGQTIIDIPEKRSSKTIYTKAIEKYNIETGKSEIIGELPYGLDSIYFDRWIYVKNKGFVSSERDFYDIQTNTTSKLKNSENIKTNHPIIVELIDGSILFIGGTENNIWSKKAYRYYWK